MAFQRQFLPDKQVCFFFLFLLFFFLGFGFVGFFFFFLLCSMCTQNTVLSICHSVTYSLSLRGILDQSLFLEGDEIKI